MEKKLKIVVGTNSLTETQYPAYTNHCQFWFRLGRSFPHIDFIISNPSRMSIDRMRNMTAKVAIETKSDYILFLDDDVVVNPNYGLKQLLDCEADVAAGKVCVRGYPFNYMSFYLDKNKELKMDSKLPKKGVVDREAVGFSFALLKVNTLKRLPEPYFITGINHTEDIYYCMKLKQMDRNTTIRVACECECGHILWPEIICEENREAYTEYFERINKIKKAVNGGAPKGGDRGAEYLKKVKKATNYEIEPGLRI